jgi:uncharacterized lipoprotein
MIRRLPLWLVLASGIVAACSREATIDCEPSERYATARSAPPVQVPDDLSPPDERNALRLPDVDAAPVRTELPDACLETPPPFSDQRPGRRAGAARDPAAEPAEPIDEAPSDPDRVIEN